VIIETLTEITLPTLPDKLRIEGGKRASLPIEDLSEEQLIGIATEIGTAWVKRANVLRGQPKGGKQ